MSSVIRCARAEDVIAHNNGALLEEAVFLQDQQVLQVGGLQVVNQSKVDGGHPAPMQLLHRSAACGLLRHTAMSS